MSGTLGLAFQEALAAFNRQDFFECHEILEALWKELPEGTQKLFYQGLLQVAVGFYHWQRENLAGAISLLARGVAKLETVLQHPDFEAGISLEAFVKDIQQYLTGLQALTPPASFPQIKTP